MSLRCLMIPTGAGQDPRNRLDAALSLAGDDRAAIELLFISPDPAEMMASMPDAVMAGGLTLDMLNEESRTAVTTARGEFTAWKRNAHLRGVDDSIASTKAAVAHFVEQTASVEAAVGLRGRLADLIIVDQPGTADPFASRAFDAALFTTGRPALVVPPRPTNASPRALTHRVLVAWSGSIEATRAIALGLPLLRAAEEVVIFSAPDAGGADSPETGLTSDDLAAYLQQNDVRAITLAAPDPSLSVGEALLQAAQSCAASMIVMGAYTHGRVRQIFLGGVTRHVLHHAAIPVLMAH